MKKVFRIRLRTVTDRMSDNEMKHVIGREGYDGYGGGDDGNSELSPKKVCVGKDLCAPCSFIDKGYWVNGQCSQNAFQKGRYCSPLNCHY